jgi:hypothetical protein
VAQDATLNLRRVGEGVALDVDILDNVRPDGSFLYDPWHHLASWSVLFERLTAAARADRPLFIVDRLPFDRGRTVLRDLGLGPILSRRRFGLNTAPWTWFGEAPREVIRQILTSEWFWDQEIIFVLADEAERRRIIELTAPKVEWGPEFGLETISFDGWHKAWRWSNPAMGVGPATAVVTAVLADWLTIRATLPWPDVKVGRTLHSGVTGQPLT